MRSSALISVVGVLGFLLAAAACSSSTTDSSTPTDDAGSSGSSGKKGSSSGTSGDDGDDTGTDGGTKKDGGKPTGPALPSDTLFGSEAQLVGLAGDDVIFIEFGQTTATMNAVPLSGGTPTKIADVGQDDQFAISGAAVALWTNVDANGLLGTLNVWTRGTGFLASVATNSDAGELFEASADGSRIAFTQDVVVASSKITSTPVTVRDTSPTSMNPVVSLSTASGNAFDYASQSCPPSMGFAGKVFFAVFCTGTATNTSTARLVTVAATGSTVDRLDASAAAASTLLPSASFSADSTGTKVFVVRKTNSEGRLITVGGSTGGVSVEQNIAEGAMLPDGSAILYRTTGSVLKKATTAASPVATTLVSADAKGILGVSPDFKNVFFHKLDPDQNSPLLDLNVVDQTAATPAAVALVPTMGAGFLGANGTSTHAVFIGDVTQSGATLKSIPIGGGTAKSLGDSVGAKLAKSGTSAVSFSNPQEVGQAPNTFTIFDITAVDTVTGTAKTIADSVPEGELFIKDKRVVYSRLAQTGSGIYAATLP